MRHIDSFLFQFSAGDVSHEFSETLPALTEITNIRLELRNIGSSISARSVIYGQAWCITRRPRADRRTGKLLEDTEQRRTNYCIYAANSAYTVPDEHRFLGSSWLVNQEDRATGDLYHLYKLPWEPPTLVRKPKNVR